MATDDGDDFETHHTEYLARQKEKVEESLREEHAEQLLTFIYDRNELKNKTDSEHLADSTARNYLRELRYVISHAYDTDLVGDDPASWTATDWNRLIRRVVREREVGDGTKRNTAYGARAFVRWLEESAVEDHEDIEAPKISHDEIKDDDVLELSEVVELINTASSARNKAIISMMYEAAMRRTALIQLDVGSYITSEGWTRIKVPDRQGVKTAAGNIIPLTWSAGYLDTWLANHPRGDDPDAPLFCSVRPQDEGKRLSSHSIYTMLKRVAERADVDEDRVHPHIFRHTRATNMRTDNRFSKGDIEVVMDWTPETPMHKRYTHAETEEKARSLAEAQGQDVKDSEDPLIECPRCGTEFPKGTEYCPKCSMDVEETPAEWWSYYQEAAPEEDPVYEKYRGVPTAVPTLAELSMDELDRVYNVMMEAHDRTMGVEPQQHSVGAEPFDSDERSVEAVDYLDQMRSVYARRYAQEPERFELRQMRRDDNRVTDAGFTLEELKEMAEEQDLL